MANTVPDSQLEFNLGEGEEETTVQLPEQEEGSVFEKEPRQEAPAPVEAKKQEALSQELDNVSENVQKRIAKLTAKMREAERREQAAIEYAKGVQAKSQELHRGSRAVISAHNGVPAGFSPFVFSGTTRRADGCSTGTAPSGCSTTSCSTASTSKPKGRGMGRK